MNIAQLKKESIRQGIITCSIIVLCVAGYLYLGAYSNTLNQEKSTIQKDITATNSRIVNFQRKQQEYEEAKKLWATLSDNQKKRSGIILANAQQLLENLKNQYALGGFKADISKPEELKDIYKTETTVVVSTKVDLTFDALTDESIFSFIGALSRGLPGYVKILSLQISREGNIGPVLLKNLQEGKYQSVVQGRLSFYWRDLKDVSEDAKAPGKGGANAAEQ